MWHKPVAAGAWYSYKSIDWKDKVFKRFLNAGRDGKKGKVLPYSLLSVGPGDDPSIQAVSLYVTF